MIKVNKLFSLQNFPKEIENMFSMFLLSYENTRQSCCLTIFQGAQKGKSQKVRSPTGNVLGAAAKI